MNHLDARKGSHGIVGALLLVGAVCIAYPALDLLLNNLPLAPTQPGWRYQVGGMVSQLMVTPFLGLALILLGAWRGRHPRLLRSVAVLCFLATLALAALTVVFYMDAQGLASVIPPDDQRPFRLATGRAMAKNIISSGVLAALGVLALRAAGGAVDRQRNDRANDRDALYGT